MNFHYSPIFERNRFANVQDIKALKRNTPAKNLPYEFTQGTAGDRYVPQNSWQVERHHSQSLEVNRSLRKYRQKMR